MAASLDYHQPPSFGQVPHRRPLPAGAHPRYGAQPDQFAPSRMRAAPPNVLDVHSQYSAQAPTSIISTSSATPIVPTQSANRRTLSNATTSTTASSNASIHGSANRPNSQAPSSYASSIRRSTSSRSGASQGPPSSYVALLRKQKATVWCDRAQHEDPRLLAQQRAAKMRAQAEMVGGPKPTTTTGRNHNSSSGGITGGVRSKIRHHGAVKASAYSGGLGNQGNLSGAGVPMRLSASEVDDEQQSENGEDVLERRYHQRNGSGRSSLGSNHRTHSGYFSINGVTPTPGMAIRTRSSNGSTPPGTSPVDARRNSLPLGRLTSQQSTPTMTQEDGLRNDYFSQKGSSGSSGNKSEERFGDVGALHQYAPSSEQPPQQVKKSNDELRRRGSVDDRTMTMSGVRLFVANPDMDSD